MPVPVGPPHHERGEDDSVEAKPHAETLLLPGAGHWPWADQPDEFRRAVLDFLQ